MDRPIQKMGDTMNDPFWYDIIIIVGILLLSSLASGLIVFAFKRAFQCSLMKRLTIKDIKTEFDAVEQEAEMWALKKAYRPGIITMSKCCRKKLNSRYLKKKFRY